MRYASALFGIVWLAAGAAGCGKNEISQPTAALPTRTPTASATFTTTSLPSATPTPTATPQAAMALFSADPMNVANPFPSDRLLDVSGHVAVPPSYLDPNLPPTSNFDVARAYVDNVINQLTALTGFPTFAAIRVRFDQPVAVDAGRNPRGLLLFEYNDPQAAPPAFSAAVYPPDSSIEIQPLLPLKPKTTYAVVVTTALVDGSGRPVRPSPDFAAVLAGAELNPELAPVRTRLQPVIDRLRTAFGITADAIALIELFTTEATTDDLVSIQRRLRRGELVPGLPQFEHSPMAGLQTGIFPEGSSQFESLVGAPTSVNVAAVAVGSFASYDFRTGPRGPFDPTLVAGPAIPPVNHLDFALTIPKAAAPPGGYPIVIFGHGLGGNSTDAIDSVPPMIGDAAIMAIGISALQHGRRGAPTGFFVFNEIAATREFFRQTVADMMQLTRMIQNARAAGIAPFDRVDPEHIMYFGVSLGGIMGSLFMAVEPEVQVGVLSVPGGGLPNILASPDIGNLLEPLVSFRVGIAQTDPYFRPFLHRFQHLAQWVLEPADPINYAPHLIVRGAQLAGVPPKRILMHEGIVDNTIPNRTTEDLALAMRLPDLNLAGGCEDIEGCSGIWRFVMTDYGLGELSGHGASFLVPQARTQIGEYLRSFGTVVIDASPGQG